MAWENKRSDSANKHVNSFQTVQRFLALKYEYSKLICEKSVLTCKLPILEKWGTKISLEIYIDVNF